MNTPRRTPQGELLERLKTQVAAGQIRICSNEEERFYCDTIRMFFPLTTFPYQGATLYWPYDPDTAKDPSAPQGLALAPRFFNEVVKMTGLSATDPLVIIWDDANYKSLTLPLALLLPYLEEFIWLPPHMYVMPMDASWCACFRMEGDMGFGFKPS